MFRYRFSCEHRFSGFQKGRGTKDQIANIRWVIERARESQKSIYTCFTDCAKASDCVGHSKLWEILQEMGTPDHLTCLLSNLYAGQEATVEPDMEQQTVVPSWERSTSRPYIVTLLI